MQASLVLDELFKEYQWEVIPAVVTTAEGFHLETIGEDWHFPYTLSGSNTGYFSYIGSQYARKALQLYCVDRARTVSSHAAIVMFQDCWQTIFSLPEARKLSDDGSFKEKLITIFQHAIEKARSDRQLWRMYRPIRWYIWCSENYAELGFCEAFALELDSIRLPGNPKGEAVKNEDIDKGPLHRTLELQQLINAMERPTDGSLKQLQERAALALFIAHGRNPANLSQLWEDDLVNLSPNTPSPTWIIRYPRIKKRLKNPRDEFRDVPIPTSYAEYILELIRKNQEIDCTLEVGGQRISLPRSMFINERLNTAALRGNRHEQAYTYPTFGITELLRSFVRRHDIVSPLTKKRLIISARRLRYTLASNLVLDGVSRRALALILDHSDSQHVEVYFDLAENIVEHLDKALVGFYAKLAGFFRGRIIQSDDEAVNGDDAGKLIPCVDVQENIGVCGLDTLCSLYPPYSCYKCPKFQAYADADHEAVFDHLFEKREGALQAGNKRIAVQLDEILYAVQQVIQLCKPDTMEGLENHGEDNSVSLQA
jgi:hypothetical protein